MKNLLLIPLLLALFACNPYDPGQYVIISDGSGTCGQYIGRTLYGHVIVFRNANNKLVHKTTKFSTPLMVVETCKGTQP